VAKQILGEAFWKVMFGRIKRCGYHSLFFESGSTIAFVSDDFEKKLRQSEGASGENSKWRITTNNAITLLQLLLHTHLDVSPRPAGAPEDYYGAMFDDILLRDPENQPQFPRPLFPAEKKAVARTVQTLQLDGHKRLYLATASGLDFDHSQTHFRGPHVGSHPNMLFKRAIFSTKQPIVLFLTASKLSKRFEVGNCYPVFGPDHSWHHAAQTCPLAVCVGYQFDDAEKGRQELAETKRRLLQELKKELKGFDFDYAREETQNGAVFMIANKAFSNLFKKE
jgi:hypothetical protein